MFIELKGKSCLVVGGGRVALRKVQVLKDFGAEVCVVAVSILPEIQALEAVDCQEKAFGPEDLRGRELVVAATDDKEENHQISLLCQKEHIPVNAVDQTEDCSFIFPAYLKEGEVVAAFSSGGQSPVVAQYLKEKMRPHLTGLLGVLAAQLGSLRARIKQVQPESARKAVYEALLQQGLKQAAMVSEEQIEKAIASRNGMEQ